MQKDSRFFEDIGKLSSGVVGTFVDLKREMEGMVMDKVETMLSRMHLVRREEFEVVRQQAEQARAESEKLTKRLAELEKLLDLKKSKG